MPISAAARTTEPEVVGGRGPHARHSSTRAGFTLVEILVVIVVIGILVSIFTLSVGGFTEKAGAEDMRRLQMLVGLASEEASIQSREIGLTFYQHGYEFSQRETLIDDEGLRYQQWFPLDDDRIFRPRDLGEDLVMELDLDGEEIILLYERDGEAEYEPQVYLLSSGDIEPPFTARLRPAFENDGFLLQAETDGTLLLSDEGAPDAE